MRRKDKEIKDKSAIEEILRQAAVCRIAMCDGQTPYVVPMCFGYAGDRLYLHCAPEGKKIDILRQNPRVCFEVDVDQELIRGTQPCKWSLKYRSVIGFGNAVLVEDLKEKQRALDVLMEHFGGEAYSYPEDVLGRVTIIRIDIESLTGKQAGYPVTGGGADNAQQT